MVDRLGFVPEASWTARVREAVRPVLPMLDPLSREQLQDLWPGPKMGEKQRLDLWPGCRLLPGSGFSWGFSGGEGGAGRGGGWQS